MGFVSFSCTCRRFAVTAWKIWNLLTVPSCKSAYRECHCVVICFLDFVPCRCVGGALICDVHLMIWISRREFFFRSTLPPPSFFRRLLCSILLRIRAAVYFWLCSLRPQIAIDRLKRNGVHIQLSPREKVLIPDSRICSTQSRSQPSLRESTLRSETITGE